MLLLEKIVEGTSRAGGTDRGTAGIVSFAFDGGSGDEIRAFVANILLRNTLENRLRAFELGSGIKMTAVLAAAKIGAAFGTLAAFGDLYGIWNYCAAHCAAQQFLKARHLHPPGNIPRRPSRPAFLRRRFRLLGAFPFGTAAVLIAALPVFAFRHLIFLVPLRRYAARQPKVTI